MASLHQETGGGWRVQWGPRGKRCGLRLGKMNKKVADQIKQKVENLYIFATTNRPWDEETSRWVDSLDDSLVDKLATAGLVPRRECATLGGFVDQYIAGRPDVKPRTLAKYRSTQRVLTVFFGADRRLRDITPGDADEFRRQFVSKKKAENTIRKHVAVAKLFFGAALKKGLIRSNPFSHLKAAIQPNRERFYFVTREETQKVLDFCPDDEWRLIVALARYGGLRCPSEHFALRWRDIDWEHGKMRVRSPKTEHHAGGESRVVPLFPELRPYLAAAFDAAEEGAEYVLGPRYRSDPTNVNLRSRLLDIIWAAGLKEWPKLFQNMRSSRETELAEDFPLHVVCGWIGNSQPVAAKHYLQTTDEHFARALAVVHKPVHTQLQKPRGFRMVRLGDGENAGSCNFLPYYTLIQVAEAGLEPARGLPPTGF